MAEELRRKAISESFHRFYHQAYKRMGAKAPVCELKRFDLLDARANVFQTLTQCTLLYNPDHIESVKQAEFVAYHEVSHQEEFRIICLERRTKHCNPVTMEIIADALAKTYTGQDKSCCNPQWDSISSALSKLMSPKKTAEENIRKILKL